MLLLFYDKPTFHPLPSLAFCVVILQKDPVASVHNMAPHDMAHRPGGLEIETSRDSIDITHLTGKEQMGADLVLQRMRMEVAQGK